MPQDMCVPCGDGYVNLRVGAIIMKGDKFLMVSNPGFGYLYTVGGRIQFGETAEQAVVREVFEETGVRMEIDRLGFIHECYFICDGPTRFGKPIYELGLYFYMKTPEAFEPVCGSFNEFGVEELLTWASCDDERLYYPAFFRTELRDPQPGVKHFFDDDRPDTSLAWQETEEYDMETIYLAGGCFWGMQKYFDQFPGVLETEVGYANGPTEAPSYQEVCRSSGHAETLRLVYDPARITLTELLDRYFPVIDPLSINRQGGDMGIQYRTGIYYVNQSQLPEIDARMRKEAEALGVKRLEVEVKPLVNFYPAEDYHQKYLDKNPGGYCHIPRRFFSMNDETKERA